MLIDPLSALISGGFLEDVNTFVGSSHTDNPVASRLGSVFCTRLLSTLAAGRSNHSAPDLADHGSKTLTYRHCIPQ